MQIMEVINTAWPIFMGIVTLIIILAKMHGEIATLKDKVTTLFDLWNGKGK